MNDLAFIKDVIYSLKREYGEPIEIHKTVQSTNLSTGIISTTDSKISVARAINMEVTLAYEFVRSLGQAKVGSIPAGSHRVILDTSDLAGWIPELRQKIVYRGSTYTITDVRNFTYAYMILASEVAHAQ